MKSSTFGLVGVQKWKRQRAVVITLGVRDHRSHVRYLSSHMGEESQENGTLILTYVGVVFKPPRLACEQTLHSWSPEKSRVGGSPASHAINGELRSSQASSRSWSLFQFVV